MSVENRTNYWRQELTAGPPPYIFVAQDRAGRGVGFVAGGPERDEIDGFDGELYAIYLLASLHGQGVGRALCQALAKAMAAAGFRSLALWVLKENPSRGFYEHLGGQFVQEKDIDIADQTLAEVALGWPDIHTLL